MNGGETFDDPQRPTLTSVAPLGTFPKGDQFQVFAQTRTRMSHQQLDRAVLASSA